MKSQSILDWKQVWFFKPIGSSINHIKGIPTQEGVIRLQAVLKYLSGLGDPEALTLIMVTGFS